VAGVGGLEVAVGLVQGVADPVAGQVGRLAADVAAGQVAPWRVLVDVVAKVQDHVEVVLGQVPVGGVVALLEVLAGHEGQVQANEGAARVGAGPGAADPAQVAAGPEAVPVVAARVEAVHLHVDGVGQGRGGGDAAPADHIPEPRPGGGLPVDRDRPGRHAAVGVERPGRQPGPEHRPGRGRVAGGHPEGERVVRPGARGGPGNSLRTNQTSWQIGNHLWTAAGTPRVGPLRFPSGGLGAEGRGTRTPSNEVGTPRRPNGRTT
jgi:hypothetical protein